MMHTIYLLLKRDFLLGTSMIKKNFGLVFIIGMFIFIYPIYASHVYMPKEPISFWDVIGKPLGGVPFELVQEHTFEFPYGWLLLQLSGATIIGTFIKDDLYSWSAFIRVRAKSIWKLWVSKLIFGVITLLAFYILLLALTWAIWEFNGQATDQWTAYGRNLLRFTPIHFSYTQTIISAILLNFFGSICIMILYVTLSIMIRSIYSYISCTSLLVISIFSNNILLIGNNSMFVRQPLFGESPYLHSVWFSFILLIFLGIFFSIIGGIYLSRSEILDNNGD